MSTVTPRTIEILQDLFDEILQIQRENSSDMKNMERVKDIVEESTKLVDKSDSTNEILLDAKILQAGSQILSTRVAALDTKLESFSEEEYTKGMLKWIQENSNEITQENYYECLAPVTYHLYSKSTSPTFMLGSLSLEPVPMKEKTKVERQKKIISQKNNLTVSKEVPDCEKKDLEENICGHILRTLNKYYKENNRKPVLFLNFIINPDSYWHSIENIFYFSFLVRDGCVNMYLNDKNLPVVEPISKSVGETHKEANQFCFSLSKPDWLKCIQKFEISSAKITPFQMS